MWDVRTTGDLLLRLRLEGAAESCHIMWLWKPPNIYTHEPFEDGLKIVVDVNQAVKFFFRYFVKGYYTFFSSYINVKCYSRTELDVLIMNLKYYLYYHKCPSYLKYKNMSIFFALIKIFTQMLSEISPWFSSEVLFFSKYVFLVNLHVFIPNHILSYFVDKYPCIFHFWNWHF